MKTMWKITKKTGAEPYYQSVPQGGAREPLAQVFCAKHPPKLLRMFPAPWAKAFEHVISLRQAFS